MRVIRDGEFFKLVRITGPSHNMLSVRYGATGTAGVEVLDKNADEGLPIDQVKQHVLAGVAEANETLDAEYKVEEIQFLRGDSPPIEIYRELAFDLTMQMNEMGQSQVN